jgi:hypothetical protein
MNLQKTLGGFTELVGLPDRTMVERDIARRLRESRRRAGQRGEQRR